MTDIFHVLNRGVDKREIFLDDQDRFRFVHNLFEFNDQENVNNNFYYFHNNKNNDFASRYIKKGKAERQKRKLLVNVHAFCLMKNHYHLLLSPRIDGGIVRFMRKLNIGYSKYFNKKYERKGALFEGRYKWVVIKDDAHFIHIPYYIHLNPLDLKFPEWRKRELKNYKEAVKFLDNYRWSSHFDYAGKKNFPSVTQRDFLMKFFEGPEEYKKSICQWLKELDLDSENFGELFLE